MGVVMIFSPPWPSHNPLAAGLISFTVSLRVLPVPCVNRAIQFVPHWRILGSWCRRHCHCFHCHCHHWDIGNVSLAVVETCNVNIYMLDIHSQCFLVCCCPLGGVGTCLLFEFSSCSSSPNCCSPTLTWPLSFLSHWACLCQHLLLFPSALTVAARACSSAPLQAQQPGRAGHRRPFLHPSIPWKHSTWFLRWDESEACVLCCFIFSYLPWKPTDIMNLLLAFFSFLIS